MFSDLLWEMTGRPVKKVTAEAGRVEIDDHAGANLFRLSACLLI